MKTLIILKGLVRDQKREWAESEKLSNFLLEFDSVRKLYSTPELLKPGVEVLSRSHTTLVHSRFMEILCSKLNKGCLVIVDMEQASTTTIETLAFIYGYTVFYKIFPIPQDYLGKPKKYSAPQYKVKKRSDLEDEVKTFLNLQLDSKIQIDNYLDIIKYWTNNNPNIYLDESDEIVHVSDLHSNMSLLNQIPDTTTELKIYHGDYIDGPEDGGSRAIIEYIMNHSENIWLEGNHDIRLRKYLGWIILKNSGKKTVAEQLYSELPSDFLNTTALEFENIKPDAASEMLKTLNQRFKTHALVYRGSECFVCTHAGVKTLDQITPKYIGNAIYGNRDMMNYDQEFSKTYYNKGFRSVHAHCKYPVGWEIYKYQGIMNIDPPSDSEVVWIINKPGIEKPEPNILKIKKDD